MKAHYDFSRSVSNNDAKKDWDRVGKGVLFWIADVEVKTIGNMQGGT